jgi:hypothetical protein
VSVSHGACVLFSYMCTWPPYLKMLFAHADQTLFFTWSAQAALKREGTHTHIQQLDKPLTFWPDQILTRPLESVLPKKGNPDPPTESQNRRMSGTREALNCHPGGVHLNFDASEILCYWCVCVWLFPILNVSGTQEEETRCGFSFSETHALYFFFYIESGVVCIGNGCL